MNIVQSIVSLFKPKAIAPPAMSGTKLPNLPVHPNYSGNGSVRQ